MSVTTLHSSLQTRALILSAVLAGGTPVAWVIRKGIGFLWDGTKISVSGIRIADFVSDGFVVMGNDGIAATQNILTDTFAGMAADDYVVSQVLIPQWGPDCPLVL